MEVRNEEGLWEEQVEVARGNPYTIGDVTVKQSEQSIGVHSEISLKRVRFDTFCIAPETFDIDDPETNHPSRPPIEILWDLNKIWIDM